MAQLMELDRAAANTLVALGPAAIPDIEAALDQVGRSDPRAPVCPGSRWLLFAYARIRGRAAVQRLRSMADDARLGYHGSNDLDTSLALALDLTSYVSASRIGYRLGCCLEPRDAMDQLILAWLQDNQPQFEGALGPRARSALEALLARRSWSSLRREMWRGEPHPGLAVGYRLDTPGDWAKSDDPLDQALQGRRLVRYVDRLPAEPDLVTKFVGVSGDACGEREIRFSLVSTRTMPLRTFVIDDPDLGRLLRLITECVVAQAGDRSQSEPLPN